MLKNLKKELGATKSISIQANEVLALDTKCWRRIHSYMCFRSANKSPFYTNVLKIHVCEWCVWGKNVEANIRHQRNNF
jgi:hypothetical protein